MTLDELKQMMGLANAPDDPLLELRFEAAMADAKSRLDQGCPKLWATFVDADGKLCLPPGVKLYILRYVDIASNDHTGIVSESLQGVGSQTFDTRSQAALLDELAKSLLGTVCPALSSERTAFFPAKARWP